ncbi:hypothetical protein KKQ11_13175 [Pseudomonas sp. MG-2]|uniref:hypothetical protein n=1 Tax=Pseudomonas sp. MG-2 TaxID=405714 RepID=UPI001C0031C3|nr:hypothetical protein [Pseudomonas sp. MG-2]MBT9236788.1 hypothetical protein [Pseudomonas sp. MG-2]
MGADIKLSSSDWAAWVQAVFSVLAIAAAIWISKAESRHLHAQEKRREIDSVFGVVVLINRGASIIRAFSGINIGGPSPAAIHSIRILADRLEELKLITVPTPVVLRASLESANLLRQYLDKAAKGRYSDDRDFAGKLERQSDRILDFYGLSDEDLPQPARRSGNSDEPESV